MCDRLRIGTRNVTKEHIIQRKCTVFMPEAVEARSPLGRYGSRVELRGTVRDHYCSMRVRFVGKGTIYNDARNQVWRHSPESRVWVFDEAAVAIMRMRESVHQLGGG